MRWTVVTAALVLAGSSIVAVAVAPSGSAKAATARLREASSSPSCIETDATGHQIWHAPGTTPAAGPLGDALDALADANHDTVAGVAMCSDYAGAAIFVANPDATLLSKIEAIRANFPSAVLDLHHVAAGLTAQLAASDRVIHLSDSASVLSGVRPDMYTGGLRITVQESSWPVSDSLRQRLTVVATANGQVAMPLEFAPGAPGTDLTTRAADSQPYYGSDEIRGSSGAICSAGVPITVNGVHAMLTAGHCTDATFTNDGHAFGSQYTTSYPGNADRYGDWKLLSGQSYGLRIFSGAVSSSSTLPVTGADWGARRNGLQMCTSGRTSGAICRYFITGSYDTELIDGVWSNHILDMRHDSTGTGSSADANGARPGDSGGPCYYSDGAGGVIAGGIVKGVGPGPTYFCTQLSGVRAWKAGATLG